MGLGRDWSEKTQNGANLSTFSHSQSGSAQDCLLYSLLWGEGHPGVVAVVTIITIIDHTLNNCYFSGPLQDVILHSILVS